MAADSDAVRQQRRRRHAQGDHTLCTRRCPAARSSAPIGEVPVSSGEKLDPAAALEELAALLMAAYRADPSNGALARELRTTLLSMPGARDTAVEDELAILGRFLSTPVQNGEPYDFG